MSALHQAVVREAGSRCVLGVVVSRASFQVNAGTPLVTAVAFLYGLPAFRSAPRRLRCPSLISTFITVAGNSS